MSRYGDNALGNQTFGGASAAVGTTGVQIPTFSPPVGPSFVFAVRHQRRVRSFHSEAGYERITVENLRDPRLVRVQWNALTLDQLDETLSFFDQFEGRGGPFYWKLPAVRPVRSPLGLSPILDVTTSGSLLERNYYVAFSWYSSTLTQETRISAESMKVVDDNQLIVVSVPIYPAGVDRARIYASETSGSLTLQATITTTEWTEPGTGLVAGASPPTSNNLVPLIPWVVASHEVVEAIVHPSIYRLDMEFLEQHVI